MERRKRNSKKINWKLINFIFTVTLLMFGSAFNMKAIKDNKGIMPVNDITANSYYLTDIYSAPNNYYFSIGDVLLFLGSISYAITIIKNPLFIHK